VILYIRYSEYVLYACVRTQLASPAESGMTIILERLCISPTEAIRQGDRAYMQHHFSIPAVGQPAQANFLTAVSLYLRYGGSGILVGSVNCSAIYLAYWHFYASTKNLLDPSREQ